MSESSLKPTERLRVYIAGPLSADTAVGFIRNHRKMMEVGYSLQVKGFAPYVPGLDILLGFQDHEGLMDYNCFWDTSVSWLFVSDCMLKIGNSPGADREEALAKILGIPIFYSVEEVETWAMQDCRLTT